MNFFKSEWIILSLKKINEKEVLYKIFFREYGKILVKKQKKNREKNLDVWYRISCEIITYENSKNPLPCISNIKILSYFKTDWKTYWEIEGYLKTLAYVEKQLPEWLPHWEIYDTVQYLHTDTVFTHVSYLLIHLKILAYSWDIEVSKHETILYKIIRFIETKPIEEIIKLKQIPQDIETKLEKLL